MEHYFGIDGKLLAWLKDYLSRRKQYTVINGKQSDRAGVTYGIPQGSVLGPTLFNLYTSDLPDSVSSGEVYMCADDTSIYSVGDTIDNVTAMLDNALDELLDWKKCEAMILYTGNYIGPLETLRVGEQGIELPIQDYPVSLLTISSRSHGPWGGGGGLEYKKGRGARRLA